MRGRKHPQCVWEGGGTSHHGLSRPRWLGVVLIAVRVGRVAPKPAGKLCNQQPMTAAVTKQQPQRITGVRKRTHHHVSARHVLKGSMWANICSYFLLLQIFGSISVQVCAANRYQKGDSGPFILLELDLAVSLMLAPQYRAGFCGTEAQLSNEFYSDGLLKMSYLLSTSKFLHRKLFFVHESWTKPRWVNFAIQGREGLGICVKPGGKGVDDTVQQPNTFTDKNDECQSSNV